MLTINIRRLEPAADLSVISDRAIAIESVLVGEGTRYRRQMKTLLASEAKTVVTSS
jgi:hypothetical protein